MSHLAALRDALSDVVNEVDIEDVSGDEWQFAYKHPVKQITGYPGFCVHPARNLTRVIDSATNEGLYVFWIDIFYTFEDAAGEEDKLVDIADTVYDTLIENLKSLSPLDGASFDGDPMGSWGSTQDLGERFYRIEVTARVLADNSGDASSHRVLSNAMSPRPITGHPVLACCLSRRRVRTGRSGERRRSLRPIFGETTCQGKHPMLGNLPCDCDHVTGLGRNQPDGAVNTSSVVGTWQSHVEPVLVRASYAPVGSHRS